MDYVPTTGPTPDPALQRGEVFWHRRVEITPELAARLLADRHTTRKLSRTHVAMLASAMRSGGWEYVGGQTDLVVASDGRLFGGQHILSAVVESGVTIYHDVLHNYSLGSGNIVDLAHQAKGAKA